MIAFGLGYLIFAIVWLHAIWHEYYCLWPGLIRLCYHVAVRRMARVLLPLAWGTSSLPSMAICRMARVLLHLAWVNSPLLSDGCMLYGASMLSFGLGYLVFAIALLHVVWHEYHCLWPGLLQLRFCMAVRRTARVSLPLDWVI